jgi:hypothetical protein
MKRGSGGALLVGAAAIVVCAAIIAGIAVLGSPATQRQRRLDAARIADLESIARLVSAFAGLHKALPADIGVLQREPGYRVPPGDPESGKPYQYEVLGTDAYRLCATFATRSSRDEPPYDVWGGMWHHGAGRQCFNRHVELKRGDAPR